LKDGYLNYWAREDNKAAQSAFRQIIAKYGASGRAYAGLARTQAALGDYDGASASYQAALLFMPGHKGMQNENARVYEYARVAKHLGDRLPKGESVLQVEGYPVGNG
jgi:tetratricopeptide (TPR) repeat protein